jgi:integrase/recombinase XerC
MTQRRHLSVVQAAPARFYAPMGIQGEFLRWCCDAGRSPVTIKHWSRIVGKFCAEHDPLTATSDDIRRYLSQWNSSPANTRHSYRVALAAFYRWIVDEAELLEVDPMRKVPKVPAPKGAPRPITDAQFAVVLADAPPTMRAWLLLGADAGLRRAEIARTDPHSPMDRRLHVAGKGGRQRVVPLSLRLVDALAAAEPWQVSPHQVGQRMSWHMRRRGVDATAHQLRHYAATRFYAASGNDLRATQAFLGHASSSTTEIYVAWSSDGLDVVDRMVA